MFPFGPIPFGRFHMADLAVRFIKFNRVPGAYLEFGVYRGTMFSHFYHLFKRHRLSVPMYAFDGFRGLPRLAGIDADPVYHQFAEGDFACTEDEFHAEMAARGVPQRAYIVVAGFFDESLTEETRARLGIDRAAVVWADCDLYESTKPVLSFVKPLLQDGTVLCFDEFYAFRGSPRFGERRAFEEFLRQHPDIEATEYAKYSSVGQSFLLHVR